MNTNNIKALILAVIFTLNFGCVIHAEETDKITSIRPVLSDGYIFVNNWEEVVKSLPSTVTAIINGTTNVKLNVTWEKPLNFGIPGKYTIEGIVDTSGYSVDDILLTNGSLIVKTTITFLSGGWNPINFTFKGTVSLPLGQVAPSNGFRVFLRFVQPNDNKSFSEIVQESFTEPEDTTIDIPAGQNSVTYEKSIEIQKTDTSFIPCFYTYDNVNGKYSSKVIYSDILYSANGNTFNNIDVIIPLAERTISGYLRLPEDSTLSKDVNIIVYAQNDINEFAVKTTLAAGATLCSFKIGVDSASDYIISYNMSNGAVGDFQGMFIRDSYLSSVTVYLNNNGEGTVSDNNLLTVDTTANNVNGLNIIMLKKAKISGTISLPNNTVAPCGGVDIRINYQTTFNIPQNQNSVPYNIYIEYGNGRTLYYEVTSEKDFEPFFVGGYCIEDGTLNSNYEQATKFYADNGEQTLNVKLNIQNDFIQVKSETLAINNSYLSGELVLIVNNPNLNSYYSDIILGIYTTENELLFLKRAEGNINYGKHTIYFGGINIKIASGSKYIYKVFIWHDISLAKPYTKVICGSI